MRHYFLNVDLMQNDWFHFPVAECDDLWHGHFLTGTHLVYHLLMSPEMVNLTS